MLATKGNQGSISSLDSLQSSMKLRIIYSELGVKPLESIGLELIVFYLLKLVTHVVTYHIDQTQVHDTLFVVYNTDIFQNV